MSGAPGPGPDGLEGPYLRPGHAAADVAAADAVRLAQGADLMAVAASALACACTTRLRRVRGRVAGARVVLLVGAGNNGGDALLAGERLRRRGVGVTALLCSGGHHGPGALALRRAGGVLLQVPAEPGTTEPGTTEPGTTEPGTTEPGTTGPGAAGLPAAAVRALEQADLLVDGLLGIGARGAVRGAGGRVLAWCGGADGDRRPPSVVACDLPSGLDPDTGRTSGPVLAADVTVTFGAAKTGLLLPWARPLVGEVQVVDLGLAPHLPPAALHRLDVGAGEASALLAGAWPWPWHRADKYSRGVLGVAAGEPAYPGAAVLCAGAAVRAGAGMVRLVPPEGAPDLGRLVLQAVPEVVVQALPAVGRVQAWVVGPGTGGEADARTDAVLRDADEPAVVDAGALVRLAEALAAGRLRAPGRLLLTPHAGELARLRDALGLAGGDGDDDGDDDGGTPWSRAREVAAATGATVLLKGPDTLVVAPDGRTVVVPGGPPALATAGAGDVLAGVAGTLLAAGLAPLPAGVLAAHVHAVAAHVAGGGGPLRASAVADAVPGVLAGAHPDAWDHG
ncbi:bifunctional ADP-dependent NAD(P)H-hydrate dehydratase/NAD(P)H-hydrate epimerase [Jannaschia sp. R86511]|uniref:bifunctional ADP-dependent NAD(P)H-hydrate dehydratase/NAD(P)H-hydrate epimerase n=1 Tax=Jannaschia sp. R86511 TaxID=3093853 RepID=UPI0036D214D3